MKIYPPLFDDRLLAELAQSASFQKGTISLLVQLLHDIRKFYFKAGEAPPDDRKPLQDLARQMDETASLSLYRYLVAHNLIDAENFVDLQAIELCCRFDIPLS